MTKQTNQNSNHGLIWFRVMKVVVMLAAWFFLIYKLVVFKEYDYVLEKIRHSSSSDLILVIVVLLLMPVNILFEALKWKTLLSTTFRIGIAKSIYAVLTGMVSGFITPNRWGDVLGRLLFVPSEFRKQGIAFAVLNAMSQNFAILVLGVPAAFLFFQSPDSTQLQVVKYLIVGLITAFLLVILVCLLSIYAQNGKIKKLFGAWILPIHQVNSNFFQAIFYSVFRTLIFSFQLYLMLLFFDVSIPLAQAVVAIPLSYLLVTFTPSVALSEVAIRSSYAVYIIGFYSSNTLGIAMASVFVWLINYALPMLMGSKWIITKK